MCGRGGHPLRRFRSKATREFSNHPNYAPTGAWGHGIPTNKNQNAELCAGCGYPYGRHISILPGESATKPECPDGNEHFITDFNIKPIK